MDPLQKVTAWIDAHQDEVVDYLASLIKIPSVNPWFSNYDHYTTEKGVQ